VSETTTTDEVIAGIDCSGKVAVVTGASGGLGLETARALASAGATVVLGVRTDEKGAAAVKTIAEQVPDARVEYATLDLGDLATVRAFAAEIEQRHPAINVLVNNAGVMFTPFERTTDGFELQFGTNHLGHFVLTNALLPALLRGAPSRIVNVSSGGHQLSDVDLDDPNYERREYNKFESYGQSKTANILFTRDLERRVAPNGVHAYAVHPGMIATNLGRHMTTDDVAELGRMFEASSAVPTFKPVAAGAATSVWAAVAPELDDRGGAYLADCEVSDDDAPWTRDAQHAQALWTLSEQLTA
jgi:NAD(P)-dependent dehydrogenase (short-subunit alcohol dehydrogenase family)